MKQPMRNLRDTVHANAKKESKLSWQWYETNVRNAAAGMSAQKFLGDNQAHKSKNVVPGDMVSFFYSPKGKDTLPYYDTFPMSLPFNTDSDSFTALNLHYLHPRVRAALLEKLMVYSTDDTLSSKTKLAFSWQALKTASQFSEVSNCVKKYLFKQVKSNFIIIPPNEWKFTIWLPLCRFKGASNEEVWSKK